MRRFTADLIVIATAVADIVWPAYEAGIAVFISTAFHALQAALDTASHQRDDANDDVGFADALNARLAVGTIRVLTALGTDQLVVDATGHTIGTDNRIGLACTSVAVEATLAICVVAALGADQLVVDATGDRPQLAEDDVGLAEAVDTGGALAALVGFAAFIAVHAFDGLVRRRPKDTAKLIFRADADTGIHAHVADFARILAKDRLTYAAAVAPPARIATLVDTAFLTYAGTAKETSRAIGGAGATVRRVVLEVFAYAFATGLALWTVGETWTAE